MKHFVCLLIAAFLMGSLVSCEQKEEVPKAVDLISLAKEFVEMLAIEDYSNVVKKFDDTMKSAMPQDKVQDAWQSLIAQVGPFKKQVGVRQTKEQGYDVVFVTCEFEKATLDIQVVFDSAKQVSGLWFRPSE